MLFPAGILVGVILMSYVEYWVHRWHMHRCGFMNRISRGTFETHTYDHHGRYYKRFDFEPDPVGRDVGLYIRYEWALLVVLPILFLLGWVSSFLLVFGIFVAIILHHLIWNNFHREMHHPSGAFFKDWWYYKFLCRYHYLHHRHVNKNFNVVFPLFDILLGTKHSPTSIEIEAMRALGF